MCYSYLRQLHFSTRFLKASNKLFCLYNVYRIQCLQIKLTITHLLPGTANNHASIDGAKITETVSEEDQIRPILSISQDECSNHSSIVSHNHELYPMTTYDNSHRVKKIIQCQCSRPVDAYTECLECTDLFVYSYIGILVQRQTFVQLLYFFIGEQFLF